MRLYVQISVELLGLSQCDSARQLSKVSYF